MTIYILCGVILAIGFSLAWWIEREARREWQRRRTVALASPITEAFIRFQIQLVDNLTPKFREMAVATQRFASQMEALGAALREPEDQP